MHDERLAFQHPNAWSRRTSLLSVCSSATDRVHIGVDVRSCFPHHCQWKWCRLYLGCCCTFMHDVKLDEKVCGCFIVERSSRGRKIPVNDGMCVCTRYVCDLFALSSAERTG